MAALGAGWAGYRALGAPGGDLVGRVASRRRVLSVPSGWRPWTMDGRITERWRSRWVRRVWRRDRTFSEAVIAPSQGGLPARPHARTRPYTKRRDSAAGSPPGVENPRPGKEKRTLAGAAHPAAPRPAPSP